MSPFLCTSCNAMLHWPKYTPHPVQLLRPYQVTGLAIHISVSLVMTINAVAKTDAVRRQIPVTETRQHPTPGMNTSASYCQIRQRLNTLILVPVGKK